MKLKFAWQKTDGELSPTCSSDVVNEYDVRPLCCLLMDDGGQRFSDTVSWLTEGLKRVKSVKDCGDCHTDWIRDAWGVVLTHERAEIYSLHDENCFEVIDIEAFENALSAWRSFIQEGPESRAILELCV